MDPAEAAPCEPGKPSQEEALGVFRDPRVLGNPVGAILDPALHERKAPAPWPRSAGSFVRIAARPPYDLAFVTTGLDGATPRL